MPRLAENPCSGYQGLQEPTIRTRTSPEPPVRVSLEVGVGIPWTAGSLALSELTDTEDSVLGSAAADGVTLRSDWISSILEHILTLVRDRMFGSCYRLTARSPSFLQLQSFTQHVKSRVIDRRQLKFGQDAPLLQRPDQGSG
jgi:hypothetical protein